MKIKRMTIISILVIFIILSIALIYLLIQTNVKDSSKGNEKWINPSIYWFNPDEDPDRQFPEPNIQNRSLMFEFFDRMNETFSDSNLTYNEANEIYKIIFDEYDLKDESYGIPGPGTTPAEITFNDLKKRAALTRIDSNTYEILTYSYGCGTDFSYTRLIIENDGTYTFEILESWRGIYPC